MLAQEKVKSNYKRATANCKLKIEYQWQLVFYCCPLWSEISKLKHLQTLKMSYSETKILRETIC